MNSGHAPSPRKLQVLVIALAITLAMASSMLVRQGTSICTASPSRQLANESAPAELKPGGIAATGSPLDIAIQGRGFIAVRIADRPERVGYTRFGALMVNQYGDLVVGVGKGYQLVPPINVGADAGFVCIHSDGMVERGNRRSDVHREVGQIPITQFDDPQALTPLGNGIFIANARSGLARRTTAGEDGTGRFLNGFLEDQPQSSSTPVQEGQ